MGANRMTGTPWHVEAKKNPEKHKSGPRKCKYRSADTNYCNQVFDDCWGPSRCPYYVEVNTNRKR